jgi:hypothetical protein
VNRTDGPDGVDGPLKSDERSGRTKSRRSGRREDRVEIRFGVGSPRPSVPFAVPGRRRGRGPPNWCMRMPGPPPKLKTNPGPVSNMPPPSNL